LLTPRIFNSGDLSAKIRAVASSCGGLAKSVSKITFCANPGVAEELWAFAAGDEKLNGVTRNNKRMLLAADATIWPKVHPL
jgi:hypothetical protein